MREQAKRRARRRQQQGVARFGHFERGSDGGVHVVNRYGRQ